MRHDLKKLKTEYLEYLEIERNRAVKTLENYSRYLDRFIRFVKVANTEDLTEDIVRQYRLHLNRIRDSEGKPLKRVTQNYHVIALRSFLRYLAKRDIRSVSAEKIELGKQEEREVSFLEMDEVQRLMDAPKGKDFASARDRAILGSLFSTGMRVSELCSLDRDTIDLNRGEVSIRGKGSKLRLVFFSEKALGEVQAYLGMRSDVDEALFIRKPKSGFAKETDLRLTPRSIQRIVRKHSIVAGIMGKKTSPHTLRHSYATDLLRNGADIRSVQALLGHSSVTTTQVYTHVTDKQLREVHEKFHEKER